MAKADKHWIIVKTFNRSLGWSHNKWGNVAFATEFTDRNYLLPYGGMWLPLTITDEVYNWTEGDLITA